MSAELATTGTSHRSACSASATVRADDAEPEVDEPVGLRGAEAGHERARVLRQRRDGRGARHLEAEQAARLLEELGVAAAHRRVVVDHRDRPPALIDEMPGQHGRLLLERAHLVVEHELAPGVLAAGVVDARQPGVVGQVAHDEPVVADRRAEDRRARPAPRGRRSRSRRRVRCRAGARVPGGERARRRGRGDPSPPRRRGPVAPRRGSSRPRRPGGSRRASRSRIGAAVTCMGGSVLIGHVRVRERRGARPGRAFRRPGGRAGRRRRRR